VSLSQRRLFGQHVHRPKASGSGKLPDAATFVGGRALRAMTVQLVYTETRVLKTDAIATKVVFISLGIDGRREWRH